MSKTKMCTRCVMTDYSDPTITFDDAGHCRYCNKAIEDAKTIYFPNNEGSKKIAALVDDLKNRNKNKPFDCLMGLSGGLDSSYLAYLGAAQWNLRITAVHIDDGFDTDIAKKNLEKLCAACNINMVFIRPDKEQYLDLIRAYMLAGVPNLAVVQDNVLISSIYKYAAEQGISDFLSGGNFALESILQQGNTYTPYDLVNIKDINRRFGTKKIDKLPLLSQLERYKYQRKKVLVEYRPLNWIDYNRDRALKNLADFCDFEYYGSKHLENDFTGFLQLYWMPKKFGVDKRHSHLSSMIISNQITRDQALEELKKPICTQEWLDRILPHIRDSFGFSQQEFDSVLNAPAHLHEYYKTDRLFPALYKLRQRYAIILNSAKNKIHKLLIS